MKATVRTILAKYRARLEEINGPRLVRVVLFGSQARGDAAPDSDIFVMIVLSGPLDHWRELQCTSRMTSDLSMEYDTVLSRVFATPDQAETDSGPFYEGVRREGVPV